MSGLFNYKEVAVKSENKFVKNNEKNNDSDDSEDFMTNYKM